MLQLDPSRLRMQSHRQVSVFLIIAFLSTPLPSVYKVRICTILKELHPASRQARERLHAKCKTKLRHDGPRS